VVKTAGVSEKNAAAFRTSCNFESQEDACEGILAGKVKTGQRRGNQVRGTKGGPGMQEMLSPTSYIMGAGLGESVAL